MARLTITEQLDNVITRLREKEEGMKTELHKIQGELKRYQKALDVLKGNSKK